MSKLYLLSLLFLIHSSLLSQINQDLVDDFARNFSYQNQIHIDEVTAILERAEYQSSIIDKMNRPAEKMSWHKYRNIFMTEERIKAGLGFWNEYEAILTQVSQDYRVDPEIIVGIIGVESYFGQRKGSYKILDALYTLSFGYPKRSRFFKSELATFLLLAKDENLDVFSIKGSYAGAMGYVQFMPSSYEAYARSYEKDGNRDLINSVEDAIASVANYFKEHRWQLGEPVAQLASVEPNAKPLEKQPLKPKYDISYYENLGYKSIEIRDNIGLVTLLTFEQKDKEEYWFAHKNFYVITRYNHSPMYALAVFQLAQAIKDRRQVD